MENKNQAADAPSLNSVFIVLMKKKIFTFLTILNAPSRRLIWIFDGRTCPKVRFLTLPLILNA